ncbi:MAG: transketolase, partial [Candidatus Marinimicrobia bacterium]|nr:transketolase [Candidatus Neomarinimicrobiota bacterium]
MRNAFADELLKQSKIRNDIVLVAADIGNRLFDRFKEANPDKFYNAGVAEANAIGMAAGLSMGGFKPVVYSIATFITARCFEQIKVDVCYNGNPVIIVGVGAGYSYAGNGATHHSFEDMAILRSLPEISIVS